MAAQQGEVDRGQIGREVGGQDVHEGQARTDGARQAVTQLGAEPGQDPLLADRAGEVPDLGRVGGVPGPGVGQGFGPAQLEPAGGELAAVEEAVQVVHLVQRVGEGPGVVDGDAADGVHHARQAVKVERDPVVDVEASDVGEDIGLGLPRLLDPARVPADGEGLVDLCVVREERVALDPQVTWDRDEGRRPGRGVDRQDVQRVRQVPATVPFATGVADEGDVHRRSAGQRAEERRRQARGAAHGPVERVGPLPEEHGADEQAAHHEEHADPEHAPDGDRPAGRRDPALLVGPHRRVAGGGELLAPGAGVDPLLAEALLAGDGGLETTGARGLARLGAVSEESGHQWPVNLRQQLPANGGGRIAAGPGGRRKRLLTVR